MAKQNVLTRSKKNKAAELYRMNRLEEAATLYASVCRIDSFDVDAWLVRAEIDRKLGRLAEAEAYCRSAIAADPQSTAVHQALGAVLLARKRGDEAIAAFRNAVRLRPDIAQSHYFLGNALRESDALNEAVASYRRAIELEPGFVEALSNLGAVLLALGQIPDAVEVLNKAVTLRPGAPQILCNLGNILEREARLGEALEKYQRALKLAPDFIDAVTHTAALLEKINRLEEAAELVNRHLPRMPENHELLVVAAKLARRENRFDDAIRLLERALTQPMSPAVAGQIHLHLGQMYDRKGDASRAFACLSEGNRLVALSTASTTENQNRYLERVERIRAYLTPDLALAPALPLEQGTAPVFLVGFPRSGTTLLEQILDSHPALQTLEEKGTVAALIHAFEVLTEGRENPLVSLTHGDVEQLRGAYFAEVDRHIRRRSDCLLVDKMPLNTVNVHLLWRIFPDAKFILAVRHPCDVCFSSFMQNFLINEAMAGFFTLESGARIYSEVMRTWQEAVRLLPLDYHQIRYEDLVADFESETRALLEFLGVGWNESVAGHTEHAIRRGTINTPSYHQVTQPIYQHAKYRWRRYASQFEPVLPVLQPFIDYFGYADASTGTNQSLTPGMEERASSDDGLFPVQPDERLSA